MVNDSSVSCQSAPQRFPQEGDSRRLLQYPEMVLGVFLCKKGIEGHVVNDSSGNCQSVPPLFPQKGDSSRLLQIPRAYPEVFYMPKFKKSFNFPTDMQKKQSSRRFGTKRRQKKHRKANRASAGRKSTKSLLSRKRKNNRKTACFTIWTARLTFRLLGCTPAFLTFRLPRLPDFPTSRSLNSLTAR